MEPKAKASLAVAILASFTLVGASSPQSITEKGATPPRWLTKQDRDELNKGGEGVKERIERLDVFVIFETFMPGHREKQVSLTALTIKDLLHRLYYDVDLSVAKHPSEDPPLFAALTEFERRAGLAVDGVFSLSEFSQLQYFANLESYASLRIQPLGVDRRVSSVGDDYVHAEGTWVMKADTIAHPINTVDIGCWREWKYCIVATGQLQMPSPSDNTASSYLTVDQALWDITSWSKSRVVAETSGTCRRTEMTIDLTAKQVFQISSDLKSGFELCRPLDSPIVVTLEGPFKVGNALYDSFDAILEKVSKSPRLRIKTLSPSSTPTPSPSPTR